MRRKKGAKSWVKDGPKAWGKKEGEVKRERDGVGLQTRGTMRAVTRP